MIFWAPLNSLCSSFLMHLVVQWPPAVLRFTAFLVAKKTKNVFRFGWFLCPPGKSLIGHLILLLLSSVPHHPLSLHFPAQPVSALFSQPNRTQQILNSWLCSGTLSLIENSHWMGKEGKLTRRHQTPRIRLDGRAGHWAALRTDRVRRPREWPLEDPGQLLRPAAAAQLTCSSRHGYCCRCWTAAAAGAGNRRPPSEHNTTHGHTCFLFALRIILLFF